MKLGVINSVFFGTEIDPYGEGIKLVKEMGFDTIDVYPADGEISVEQMANVKKYSKEYDIPVRAGVALIFGYFSPNRPVREFAKKLGRQLVDISAEMGAHNMLIVNGEYFWQLETGFDKDWIFNMAVEGTRDLGEHAAKCGLKIAVELEPFKMSIVNSIDSMDAFLSAVDLPDTVMANVDCSHLHLADISPTEIQRLKGRIAHVHISDAIDKHGDLPPGRGTAPMQEYIDQLKIAGFDGTVACELEWPPDPSREGVLAWVKEAGDATAQLMRNAGVRD
ncbi:sugar phosphate isomerase/epimerase family protein [Candidatus Leptofilum sp.]|uniref:sugar phosphate isomerase/epimerase family protein n=1 Tax=Candidatus Leptofilum sp. TaxID=3241576 RepID=UPI003B5C7416